MLVGASLGLLSAQALGLVALGFSSVYREGFETVLFLQALTLEAGAFTVLQGVGLGVRRRVSPSSRSWSRSSGACRTRRCSSRRAS